MRRFLAAAALLALLAHGAAASVKTGALRFALQLQFQTSTSTSWSTTPAYVGGSGTGATPWPYVFGAPLAGHVTAFTATSNNPPGSGLSYTVSLVDETSSATVATCTMAQPLSQCATNQAEAAGNAVAQNDQLVAKVVGSSNSVAAGTMAVTAIITVP